MMTRILTSLLLFTFSHISLLAVQTTKADSLYSLQEYQEAGRAYEDQLAEGIHAETFFNLGNCYYYMDDTPRAILNYMKALKMEPGHIEAKDNLQLCLEKAGITTSEGEEMFYTTMTKSLLRSKNANEWGTLGIGAFAVFVIFITLYLLLRRPLYKKVTFFIAIISLLGTIAFNIFAFINKQRFTEVEHVVSMSPAPVYETASTTGEVLSEVPAGSVLKLNDAYDDQWVNITLTDGREGWCERQKVGLVSLEEIAQ